MATDDRRSQRGVRLAEHGGSRLPPSEDTVARVRVAQYVGLAVLLIGAFLALRNVEVTTNEVVHTVLETIASVLALVAGVAGLIRFYSKKSNEFLFIGVAFLGTALLDAFHAIVTAPGVPDRLPSTMSSLAPWSWTASRSFLSIFLLLAFIFWWRESRLGARAAVSERLVYVLGGLLTVGLFVRFTTVPLPPGYYLDLPLARPHDLIPGVFFALALAGFVWKGDWRRNEFEHWLVISLIVGTVGQLVFMTSSSQLFDSLFDAAHYLKKGSYLAVLVGLNLSTYRLFRIAQIRQNELEDLVQQRTTALEFHNRELEQFTWVAAHDLQEPLRKIQAFGDQLVDATEGRLDDWATTCVDRMVDGAQRMQVLIDDLLAYTRVTTRGRAFEQTDTGDIIRQVIDDLSLLIGESDAEIEVGDMPIVTADSTQLQLLFQNLIANAVKFRKEGVPPRVSITADQIPAGRRHAWRFVVEDNGIGFDQDDADKIFQAFQQLHGRGVYGGSGMGLAICRRIVERHGGSISAVASPGAGARFEIVLPDSLRGVL